MGTSDLTTSQAVRWGVWDLPDGVHVAPCNEYGYVVGHILDDFCLCEPVIEQNPGDKKRRVIHHAHH